MISAAAASAAKRRKGGDEGGEDKVDASEVRWLISYSDYMMQLVCLFILLFSVSSFEKERLRAIAESVQISVYGKSKVRGAYPNVETRKADPNAKQPAYSRFLQSLKEELKNYGGQDTAPRIEEAALNEGVKITVRDAQFDEGKADVPKPLETVLRSVAQALRSRPATRIEIRGHTSVSRRDVAGPNDTDGLLLSFQRARNVSAFLLEQKAGDAGSSIIKPERVRVTACANHEPANPLMPARKDGDTADRRVEIVVTEERLDRPAEQSP